MAGPTKVNKGWDFLVPPPLHPPPNKKNKLPQHLVATSLSEATRAGKRLRELVLPKSMDLKCVNLMCEKVGTPCICRLARVLALTPEVERLDLSQNELTALPEEVFKLRNLRTLDLSQNRLTTLPPGILQLARLEVLAVDGNPLQWPEGKEGPRVQEFVEARRRRRSRHNE